MKHTIYLSARWLRREQVRDLRTTILQLGHAVRSRWLDCPIDTPPATCAAMDMADIDACDLLIAFTEPPDVYSTGGRHVEFGLALAARKPIWIVGPEENVFHYLTTRRFNTEGEMLQLL